MGLCQNARTFLLGFHKWLILFWHVFFFLVWMIFLHDTRLQRGKKCNVPFGELSLTLNYLYKLETFFQINKLKRQNAACRKWKHVEILNREIWHGSTTSEKNIVVLLKHQMGMIQEYETVHKRSQILFLHILMVSVIWKIKEGIILCCSWRCSLMLSPE